MVAIYAKTRKGQEEIEVRSGDVPQRARRLLILVDGKRGVDELGVMLGDPDIQQTLALLEQEGYIETAALAEPLRQSEVEPQAPAAESATPGLADLPPARSAKELDMARHFMMNTLKTFNGPYAKLSLVQRIHASDNPQALRSLFEEWFSAIQETQMGRKRAEDLRDKLFAVL